MKINITNFHLKSKGTFIQIDSIPKGFRLIYDSPTGSQYFANDDNSILIRKSDHWGRMIKKCSWFLRGYFQIDSLDWKEHIGTDFILGMIEFKNLSPNYRNHLKPSPVRI